VTITRWPIYDFPPQYCKLGKITELFMYARCATDTHDNALHTITLLLSPQNHATYPLPFHFGSDGQQLLRN